MAKRKYLCPSAPTGRCDDPHCRGWAWFNGSEIERCDQCKRFDDDMEAALHVQGCDACSKYLKASGGTLTVNGMGYRWDSMHLCTTAGEPGCWHGDCDTCGDGVCFPPGTEPTVHTCSRVEHDIAKEDWR